jgi:peptide/nickel transport system permease protein
MASITPAEAELQIRTAQRSPLSSMRGNLAGLWGRPITQAITKALLTIYVTSTITFVLIRLMPGSPVELKIDELMQQSQMTYADAAAQVSGLFDIDLSAPIHEQYFEYLGKLAQGNLGSSFLSRGTSVMSIILSVLPWTLFAVGTGLLLSFVFGIGLGLIAAYRRNSPLDHAVSTGGSIISSVPGYLVALLIVLIFGIQLRWVPITQMRGAFSPGIAPGFTPEFLGDILFHAALPITVFFLTHLGLWILSMRSATLAALEEDHVTVARARGLSDGRITTAYVGRNAVLPLVSQFAIAAGAVVGGAVVIEQIFVYQGVGLRLVKAVDQRDYPVMQGIVLMTTICVIVANLIADLLYSKLDPRIGRAGGASGT